MHLVLNTSLTNSKFIQKSVSFEGNDLLKPTEKSTGRGKMEERSLSNTKLVKRPIGVEIGTSVLKPLMNTFKDKIELAQFIAGGRKATAPCHYNTRITKVSIKRCEDIKIESSNPEPITGSINAEWVDYEPNRPKERVILYLHGGAYVVASRRTHRCITWRLSKYADAKILSIDYELAPKGKFPAPLIDAISTYRVLLTNYKPSQISFVGDSAGGCLAIACALYCRDTGHLPMPGALGPMAPFLDITQSLPSWILNKDYDYLPHSMDDAAILTSTRTNPYVEHDIDFNNVYVSPVTAKEDKSKPLPPTLIQVGGIDRVRDDGIFYANYTMSNSPIRLEIYQECVHVFQLFAPLDKFARLALKRMGTFLKEQTGLDISTRPTVERQNFRILRESGFPVQVVEDAGGIIEDGINICIQKGVWKASYEGYFNEEPSISIHQVQ